MPEELNRILTDQLSALLFTPSEVADHNLLAQAFLQRRIYRVGKVMIDSVVRILPRARQSTILAELDLHERAMSLPHCIAHPMWTTRRTFRDCSNVLSELVARMPVVSPCIPEPGTG